MMGLKTYNVTVLCKEGSRQLLLIVDDSGPSICVYDEHSGQTLMRMASCSLECLERAIGVMRA
jgi:hypothetical protein